MKAEFRPESLYPIYPPYHQGEYLEEYFYKRWNEDNNRGKSRKYIDIFWTNLYNNRAYLGHYYPDIQKELMSSLKLSDSFFTVCQLDDGPIEELLPDIIIFSAGGNRGGDNIIPIPLICSKIPDNLIKKKEKTVFASFVGSRTHFIRNDVCKYLRNNENYVISSSTWNPQVSNGSLEFFLEVTASSRFGLAPRGYGKQSFRFYEIMQLGAVPVYISDEHYLPWSDELDWNDFSVLIDEDNIKNTDEILKSIDDVTYNKLLENGQKVYDDYFTLEGMYKNIIKRIK